MKYRQNEWDGEFETYDEWARFGPQPPVQECDLSRCSRSTLHFSARFRACTRGWGIPGEVLLDNARGTKTRIGRSSVDLNGCLSTSDIIPQVGFGDVPPNTRCKRARPYPDPRANRADGRRPDRRDRKSPQPHRRSRLSASAARS